MKKLFLILFLVVGYFANGQILQEPNVYGYKFKRVGSDSLHFIPRDTMQVPTRYNGLSFIANKGGALYYWNGTKWASFSSSGSSYTFTNGITESGGTVKLGGILSENTTILGNNHDFNIDSFSTIGFHGKSNDPGDVVSRKSIYTINSDDAGEDGLFLKSENNSDGDFAQVRLVGNEINMRANNYSIGVSGGFNISSLNATLSTTGKKIMLRDTATGLVQNIDPALIAGSTNSNVGAKYRLAIPNTNNIKTLDLSKSVKGDTATTNEIAIALDNDVTTPDPYSTYGYDSTKGWKKQAVIDLTGALQDYELFYDKNDSTADGRGTIKARAATGGSGSAVGKLFFKTGVTTYAPDVGDSFIVNSSFKGKRIVLFRDTDHEDSSVTFGWYKNIDTIFFNPVLSENETVTIYLYDSTGMYDVALEQPPTPPCTPVDMDYDLLTGGVSQSPANQWNFTTTSDHASNSLTSLPANGYFEAQIPGTSMVVGIDDNSTPNDYWVTSQAGTARWEYAIFNFSGNVYAIEEGDALTTPTIAASVGSNTHFRIIRVGTTVKLQLSSDGTTFTDTYTFPTTSAATLYAKASNGSGLNRTVINPKTCGFE